MTSICSPNKGREETLQKNQMGKNNCAEQLRSKARGCTGKYLKVGKKKKRGKKKSENSKEICEALKSDVFLFIHHTYFWSTELHLESTREGQVEEGVRVALLKLDTDGSRPMGEISESCKEKTQGEHLRIGLQLMFTPGWKCCSAGKAQVTERLFHQLFPSQYANLHTNHQNPIREQEYSSTSADTACNYQCPTLLIIHTLTSSVGKIIIQFETWCSLCLQVEFLRAGLSFHV